MHVSTQPACVYAKSEKLYIAVIRRTTGRGLGCLLNTSVFSIFTQVVNVLRSQLNQLDEIKKERETMEGEIKAVTFDMTVTFLTALAQSGAINEEQLSVSQLDQLYGSYNQRVQASLRSQEELLGQVQVHQDTNTNTNTIMPVSSPNTTNTTNINSSPTSLQVSHQEFSSLKQSNTEANQRDEVLKKLASAHDSYVEISSNLREGTKVLSRRTNRTSVMMTARGGCLPARWFNVGLPFCASLRSSTTT